MEIGLNDSISVFEKIVYVYLFVCLTGMMLVIRDRKERREEGL